MATIQIGAITIANAQDAADAQSAMSAFFATANVPSPTSVQVLEYLRLRNIAFIKQVTKDWRAAQVAVVEPGAT